MVKSLSSLVGLFYNHQHVRSIFIPRFHINKAVDDRASHHKWEVADPELVRLLSHYQRIQHLSDAAATMR